MASPERISFEIIAEDEDTAAVSVSFKACNLCKHPLVLGKDVYMFRDRAYCSVECRSDQIILKKREEKKAKSTKIKKTIRKLDVNSLDKEATLAWVEKFRSRKRFRTNDKENVESISNVNENVKSLEAGVLAGLGFVIGPSSTSSINKARQRKISSPVLVNRAQKYSKHRTRLEKRKLKSSSDDLLSQDHNQQDVIMQDSVASLSFQGVDHVINIDYKQDQGMESHQTDGVEWTILLATLALEAIAATFDQVSSPSKPYYALIGVIASLIALLICVGEIIYKARKERVSWRRKGRICWLYHPSPKDVPFGSIVDCFGLASAIVQCIFSIVEYAYFVRHANNPVKLCILPIIFALCLVFSRLIKNRGRNASSMSRMYDKILQQQVVL